MNRTAKLLIALVVLLMVFLLPFRWAFIENAASNTIRLVGFLLTLAGFLAIGSLMESASESNSH